MSAAKAHNQEPDDVAVRGVTSGTFPKVPGSFDEHATLDHMLAGLEAPDLVRARERLASLLLFLERHFEREESPGGFFDMALDHAPRYQARVSVLREEHAVVLARVDGLLIYTYDADELTAEIASGISDIIEMLRRHEQDEHSLMQLVLQVDIAASD